MSRRRGAPCGPTLLGDLEPGVAAADHKAHAAPGGSPGCGTRCCASARHQGPSGSLRPGRTEPDISNGLLGTRTSPGPLARKRSLENIREPAGRAGRDLGDLSTAPRVSGGPAGPRSGQAHSRRYAAGLVITLRRSSRFSGATACSDAARRARCRASEVRLSAAAEAAGEQAGRHPAAPGRRRLPARAGRGGSAGRTPGVVGPLSGAAPVGTGPGVGLGRCRRSAAGRAHGHVR